MARFRIEFAASVADQLFALTRGEPVRLLDAIERQLAEEPLTETRNRKPLRPNPVAPWELRVGALRVFSMRGHSTLGWFGWSRSGRGTGTYFASGDGR